MMTEKMIAYSGASTTRNGGPTTKDSGEAYFFVPIFSSVRPSLVLLPS